MYFLDITPLILAQSPNGVWISLEALVSHTLSALVASAVVRLVASSLTTIRPCIVHTWYRFVSLYSVRFVSLTLQLAALPPLIETRCLVFAHFIVASIRLRDCYCLSFGEAVNTHSVFRD